MFLEVEEGGQDRDGRSSRSLFNSKLFKCLYVLPDSRVTGHIIRIDLPVQSSHLFESAFTCMPGIGSVPPEGSSPRPAMSTSLGPSSPPQHPPARC